MLESFPISVVLGILLGILSGLGTGGGSLLILWLTLILNLPQQEARAINLLFFLPSALIACCFRWKQGSLKLKRVLPAIAAGAVTAAIFSLLTMDLDTQLLKKGFGLLLLIVFVFFLDLLHPGADAGHLHG